MFPRKKISSHPSYLLSHSISHIFKKSLVSKVPPFLSFLSSSLTFGSSSKSTWRRQGILKMSKLTIYGQMNPDLEETVRLLRERNVGVVIRDEREFNRQLLPQAKDKAKGKEKVSCSSKGKGKENIGSKTQETVKLPSTIHRCRRLDELLCIIYPRLNVEGTATLEYLTERTILAARNDDVNIINKNALDIFPGEACTYLAADKMSDNDGDDRAITNRYPNEYLNSLDPPGLPQFNLQLKVGCPIMLLRNIAPADGLCNGTRLMVVRNASRVIEARILTGDKAGNLAFIPRISLAPSSTELPFNMTRRQFPIRLAYAMTINKSQGQSVNFVGIDLRNPVFSHGQLYVALSRCTSFDRISVLLPEGATDSTTNIVYPEVLI